MKKVLSSFVLLMLFMVSLPPTDQRGVGHAAAAPVFPIQASGDGHYLVDQGGTPFRITGDSAWAIPYNLSPTDAQSYITQRHAQGFNLVLMTAIDNAYGNGRADFSTYDGILPFTG